jgi:hypothetical protein
VVVDRLLLLDALKRAQLMSSETRGVKMTLGDATVVLSSDNPDIGEAREELDAEVTGGAMSIGFNARYVVDFLAAMTSDQVAFELKGELDPGLLRPVSGEEYAGVVMLEISPARCVPLQLHQRPNLAPFSLSRPRGSTSSGDNGRARPTCSRHLRHRRAALVSRSAWRAHRLGAGAHSGPRSRRKLDRPTG